MSMDKPHRITTEALGPLPWGWQVVASATTADRSQGKRLEAAIGAALFRVTRRYHAPDSERETVCEGPDLAEAVRFYNGLS